MWQLQIGIVQKHPIQIKQIEIERARAVMAFLLAITAERALDPVQDGQRLVGAEMRVTHPDGVAEWRTAGAFGGLGHDRAAATRRGQGKPSADGLPGQGEGGRRIGEVAAEGNEDASHAWSDVLACA